jgi:ABC-type polysaccharide/polyol phosphate export permease
LRHEFTLMEQGTPLGFVLAFLNNVVMLFVFQVLFVDRFLTGVPNASVYLLLGIVQWNLYINTSMAGFGCFLYRQKLVMGYPFPREILVLARTAAVFVPYLIELTIILLISAYLGLHPGWNIVWLPVLLVSQYLFCAGLCSIFAFIGVIHKNIIPFWNLMFRVLSFATPIFYLPVHFQSSWANFIYTANPFTTFMIWLRDLVGANGFEVNINPFGIFGSAAVFFLLSYLIFRSMEHRVGDAL